MSIETILKAHTEALNRFCDMCEKHGINLTAPQLTETAPQVSSPASDQPKVKKAEPVAEVPAEVETAEEPEKEPKAGDWIPQEERADEQPTAEAPTTPEPVADTPATIDEVVTVMKQVLTKKGRNAVVTILGKFGVSKATEIDSRDLTKAKQAFEAELEE